MLAITLALVDAGFGLGLISAIVMLWRDGDYDAAVVFGGMFIPFWAAWTFMLLQIFAERA